LCCRPYGRRCSLAPTRRSASRRPPATDRRRSCGGRTPGSLSSPDASGPTG